MWDVALSVRQECLLKSNQWVVLLLFVVAATESNHYNGGLGT